jgi:hypothetical protein
LSLNDRVDRRKGGSWKIGGAKSEAIAAIRVADPEPVIGANITLHWRIPNKGRRDADNMAATLKVCQDALVACEILPDDSWVCVPQASCRIHPPDGPAAMWLELDVLTERPAA